MKRRGRRRIFTSHQSKVGSVKGEEEQEEEKLLDAFIFTSL